MNNNNTDNKQITSFLKLKNKKGEDIYLIDKLGEDTLLMSTLKPMINSFETLILCDTDRDICEINVGREFINTIAYAIQRKMYDEEENETKKEQVKFLLKSDGNVVFRDIDECLPNITIKHGSYKPPNSEQIVNSLEKYKTEAGLCLIK